MVYFYIGVVSFQKYGSEEYYCDSMGTECTMWDHDLSYISLFPGDTKINSSDIYIKNL